MGFRNILKRPSQIAALLNAVGLLGDTSGAVASGVSAAPSPGVVQQTLTFNAVSLALIDNAGVGAHASLKFWTFEKGQINIVGCVVNLTETKTTAGVNANFAGLFGIGSVACDNSATLTSTEQNVVPSTVTPAATAGVSAAKGKQLAATLLDGSTTAVDLYLNVLVNDADQDVTTTPCNLLFSGTITLTYENLGAA